MSKLFDDLDNDDSSGDDSYIEILDYYIDKCTESIEKKKRDELRSQPNKPTYSFAKTGDFSI